MKCQFLKLWNFIIDWVTLWQIKNVTKHNVSQNKIDNKIWNVTKDDMSDTLWAIWHIQGQLRLQNSVIIIPHENFFPIW